MELPATSVKRRSLLEHALTNEGVAELLSAKEWREEAKAMVVAGQGTVAHCLSFALLLLAMHPEQQRRLHQVNYWQQVTHSGLRTLESNLDRALPRYCDGLVRAWSVPFISQCYPPRPLGGRSEHGRPWFSVLSWTTQLSEQGVKTPCRLRLYFTGSFL